MADVTKLIDRSIPVTQRMQVFTDSDGGAGDVFLVSASLGKPAKKVVITATDAVSVVFNIYHDIAKQRTTDEDLSPWAPGLDNTAVNTQIEGNNPTIAIAAGDVMTLDNDMPVDDIKIISADGTFNILVM